MQDLRLQGTCEPKVSNSARFAAGGLLALATLHWFGIVFSY
jgi:hypothetical protein